MKLLIEIDDSTLTSHTESLLVDSIRQTIEDAGIDFDDVRMESDTADEVLTTAIANALYFLQDERKTPTEKINYAIGALTAYRVGDQLTEDGKGETNDE